MQQDKIQSRSDMNIIFDHFNLKTFSTNCHATACRLEELSIMMLSQLMNELDTCSFIQTNDLKLSKNG